MNLPCNFVPTPKQFVLVDRAYRWRYWTGYACPNRDCDATVETFSYGEPRPGDRARCECGLVGKVARDGLEVEWDE